MKGETNIQWRNYVHSIACSHHGSTLGCQLSIITDSEVWTTLHDREPRSNLKATCTFGQQMNRWLLLMVKVKRLSALPSSLVYSVSSQLLLHLIQFVIHLYLTINDYLLHHYSSEGLMCPAEMPYHLTSIKCTISHIGVISGIPKHTSSRHVLEGLHLVIYNFWTRIFFSPDFNLQQVFFFPNIRSTSQLKAWFFKLISLEQFGYLVKLF